MILELLLGTLLSTGTAPSESTLIGEWGYSGNSLVFMDERGDTPSKDDVDAQLKAMGASHSNCVLTFSEDHRCNLRLGGKSIDFDWTLDKGTKTFKAGVGPFVIKGYLMMKNGRIHLIYSRANLFTIIRYLCAPSAKKNISQLGELLDCCKGLTLCMEFSKR